VGDRSFDFRLIALEAIDPPPVPMRDAMDPEKLGELEASIRDKGILSPLGVYARGDRFVIIYGHRRYVAAQHVGELAVPCRVHEDGSAREEDYKFTENYFREDVNPAAEAAWFADLLERKHAGNIEALCAELGLRESFVQGRLDLLRGGEDVLLALRDHSITLSVARELNKIRPADWRSFYLADAIAQGATAAIVQRWRIERERLAKIEAAEARGELAAVPAAIESPIHSIDVCLVCALPDDPLEMEFARVHKDCARAHRRAQRAALAGGTS
jgi:ParB/RepB/Spo0J family partition protein